MYILVKSDNGTITTETFKAIDLAIGALEEDYNKALNTGEYKKFDAVPEKSCRQLVSKKSKAVVSWKIEEFSEHGKLDGDGEDKEKICKKLCKALQATRFGSDLIDIRYKKTKDGEIAELAFLGGVKFVNVTLDSGAAMIKDIVNNMGL